MELAARATDRRTPVDQPDDEPGDDNPAALVVASVEVTLELARTWLGWDGRPRVDREGRRVYTPHKAIRRTADHAAAGAEEWDRPRDPNWTLRQIAEHVGTAWYAEQIGSLGTASR